MAVPTSADDAISWLAWVPDLTLIQTSYIVRIVSGFFITLGIICIFPVALLIAVDFLLYIWRLYWSMVRGEGDTSPDEPRVTQTLDEVEDPFTTRNESRKIVSSLSERGEQTLRSRSSPKSS